MLQNNFRKVKNYLVIAIDIFYLKYLKSEK